MFFDALVSRWTALLTALGLVIASGGRWHTAFAPIGRTGATLLKVAWIYITWRRG
jgi:hypothetical protein